MARSRAEIQAEYDEMYRQKPDRWGSKDRSNFMIQVLNDFMPNPRCAVDIGCGNGVTLENYRRYNQSAILYGIDPSPEGIRLAKKRVPDGIFTIEDEFKDIKKFDLVICMGVAEHAEELPEFLKSLKERLTDKGICYFEVPNCLAYSAGPETYRRLETKSRQFEWHLPLETWESMLIEAGFEVVKRYKGLNVTWEFVWILR